MYEKIPTELTQLKRWVLVRNDSKIPFQASGECASSVNPDTWCDFQTATAKVASGAFDYVGFVFNEHDGYVGIDLDKGLDEDGFLSDEAVEIIHRFNSYTEMSRSGRGVHIIVKGTLPTKGMNNRNGAEIYCTSRYFICTGNSVNNAEIVSNQSAIDEFIKDYFPNEQKVSSKGARIGTIFYQVEYDKPSNGKINTKPHYPKCPQGTRNASMASLAGQLHSLGYDKNYIYREVCRANTEACEPPLGNNEIINIINSICRYRR